MASCRLFGWAAAVSDVWPPHGYRLALMQRHANRRHFFVFTARCFSLLRTGTEWGSDEQGPPVSIVFLFPRFFWPVLHPAFFKTVNQHHGRIRLLLCPCSPGQPARFLSQHVSRVITSNSRLRSPGCRCLPRYTWRHDLFISRPSTTNYRRNVPPLAPERISLPDLFPLVAPCQPGARC